MGGDSYKSGSKMGTALIIGNENFQPETGREQRPGTDHDIQRLQATFSEMGFQARVSKDLTCTEMIKETKIGKSVKAYRNLRPFMVSLASSFKADV